MPITQDTAVTLRYTVHELLPNGSALKLLDKGHMAYLHGGYENIFPKVEAALADKTVGDSVTVDLAVEDAFGAIDNSLKRTIPKGDFPPGVKVGGQLRGSNGQGEPQVDNVVEIKGPGGVVPGGFYLKLRKNFFARGNAAFQYRESMLFFVFLFRKN